MSIARFNQQIAAKGIKAELVKGDGYLYFVGADVELADSTSVWVSAFCHLSIAQWWAELEDIQQKHKAVVPYDASAYRLTVGGDQ